MSFKDHFSGHADRYETFRPGYPEELFRYLASLAPARERAWDCATGNGQAARGLAAFFGEVVATDASEAQIGRARPHPGVTFMVAPAERSGLESGSVDLVVAAQALHWLDRELFYAEARRVARPEGVVAAWCYDLPEIAPEIDALIRRFYEDTVGAFWPPERTMVATGYRDVEFPFDERTPPRLEMTASWDLMSLLGYLGTWSSVERFRRARGFNPLEELAEALGSSWGPVGDQRPVRWPLALRVGVVRGVP